MADIAYQRAQDTIRSLLGLPPAESLVDVNRVISPVLDVLSLYDARDQQCVNDLIADVAPGAQQQVVRTVPANEIWLLDACSVSVNAPVTSGDAITNLNVTMNRNGIAITITLIDTAFSLSAPGLPARRGLLLRPPLALHSGDQLIARVINRAANVGNATAGRLQAVYRELEARAQTP